MKARRRGRQCKENLVNRPPARTFEDLIVWQKSHALVLQAYRASQVFPKDEIFGLRVQLRRAVVSVPANIAEGFKKRGKADKIRFLNNSQGSLEEVRYYFILAHDLGFLDTTELRQNALEVGRLLDAYMKGIEENWE